MPSALSNLVKKEIKEMLRDPKILLGMVLMPLIVFPIMGAAINMSTSTIEKSMRTATLAVMKLDHGPMADQLIASFKALNVSLLEIQASPINEAIRNLEKTNITTLIVIPPGFTENLTSGLKGELDVYAILRSISLSEGAKASAANAPISIYEKTLVYQAVKQAFPDRKPENVLDPIAVKSYVMFRGRLLNISPEFLQGIFMSQSFGFPMVIMLMLISAMQIAATSISIEKEEKTLETLLTLPVRRLSILAGKLAGSIVVAAAGAIAAIVGVNFYAASIFSFAPADSVDLAELGLSLSPLAYFLLGVTMFVTIISALALAICIAVFSENVREAQSLIGPFSLIVILPSLVLMFADIDVLPFYFQIILYLMPYTHSILASKAAFIGDYITMLRSIACISLFTIVVLYIAAKIFTTEKVITARLTLRKPKIKQ